MGSVVPLPPGLPGAESASFLGRGIAWPMGVDHTGAIAMSGGFEDIERSVRIILSTSPGERLMRPQFGCRVWDLVFEPVNETFIGLMGEAVLDALVQWEPRIVVDEVLVLPDDDEAGLVRVLVRYRVRTTNDARNLVFPFYVIPKEAD